MCFLKFVKAFDINRNGICKILGASVINQNLKNIKSMYKETTKNVAMKH